MQLIAGAKLRIEGVPGEILYSTPQYTLIKCGSLDEPQLMPTEDFHDALYSSIMPVESLKPSLIPKGKLSALEQLELGRKRKYVQALVSKGVTTGGKKVRDEVIQQVSQQLDDSKPPSAATLGRWVKQEQEYCNGVAHKLIERQSCVKSSKFTQDKIIALEYITDVYLQRNKPSVKSVYSQFYHALELTGRTACDIPSYSTFAGWVRDICPIDKAHKREGRYSRNTLARNAVKKHHVTGPLKRVECDGLHLAIGLCNSEGDYLGTPLICIVMDVYTRAILGYSITVAEKPGESASAVIQSYRHAMNTKPLAKEASYENEWPMFGRFEAAWVDGGPGYKSLEAVSFMIAIGSAQVVVESRQGWKKPFVERFNNTVRQQFATQFKGYCGHNESDASRTPEKTAHMSQAEFVALFEKWIVDDYHQQPHSGLYGCTPMQMWTEAIEKGAFCPSALDVENYEQLMLPRGINRQRKILGDACHLGVHMFGLRYNSNELKNLGLSLNDQNSEIKVNCHMNSLDISSISVEDPRSGTLFEVPNVDDRLKGMTLQEWELMKSKYTFARNKSADKLMSSLMRSQLMQDVNNRAKKSNPIKQVRADAKSLGRATSERMKAPSFPSAQAPDDSNVEQHININSDTTEAYDYD